MSSQRNDELPRLKRPDEIDDVFGRANPNPDRIGCPSPDVLVALARRQRPIGDPAYDHLSECSPCYLEVRALKEAADLQRRRVLTWGAAAAALILATGSAGWLLLNRGTSGEPIATELRTQLDLRPYALMRGETPQGDRPPLILPRARVLLTLLLPTGSEPGPYDVEIRESSAVRASAHGDASLRNQITTLEVVLNLASLGPGPHHIGVRRRGEDWQLFPCRLE